MDFETNRERTTEPGVFEFGLVMAGSVAGGAYFAGVMDGLIEALDAWEKAKAQDRERGTRTAPPHQTILKVLSGSAAGVITTGVAATALEKSFSPVRAANTPATAQPTGNPLFDAWVNDLDIRRFLASAGQPTRSASSRSLFDRTMLEEIATRVFQTSTERLGPRAWVADPLRTILAKGESPTRALGTTDKRGADAAAGDRFNRFAPDDLSSAEEHVGGFAHSPSPNPVFEHEATTAGRASLDAWTAFDHAALTGERSRTEPALEMIGRGPAVPGKQSRWADETGSTLTALPHTPLAGGNRDYRFPAIDGGDVDNDPVDLARRVLAGPGGRNPREGKRAHRALIMIDPFPDEPPLGPANVAHLDPEKELCARANLANLGLAPSAGLKDQTRFRAGDLALAHSETVYSRFVLKPDRGSHNAASAPWHLASSALGGFGGFLDRDYRRHDYLLGRRNVEWFLRHHFALPPENPLFDGWRGDPALYRRFRIVDPKRPGKEWLPIIPLMTPLVPDYDSPPNPCPTWPSDRAPLADLRKPFAQRLNALSGDTGKSSDLPWWTRLATWAARPAFRDAAWRSACRSIEQSLKQHRL